MGKEVFFYIIVVSSNAGEKLAGTIRNILAQSHGAFHVLVQDNASTDGSVQEAASLVATSKGRVSLRVEKDDGIYDAMNRGVRAALALETEREKDKNDPAYVLFLNCGDRFYDNDVLKKASSRIRQIQMRYAMRASAMISDTHPAVCYGDTYERKTAQTVSANPRMDDFACYRNIPCHQSIFYDLSLLAEEPFDTQYQVRADYEQFLRLKYKRHASMIYLRMTIADYEGSGFSEQKANQAESEQERKAIIALYLPKKKILQYDAYRKITFAGIRGKLASSPKTAPLYQKAKKSLYGRGKKEKSETTKKEETE